MSEITGGYLNGVPICERCGESSIGGTVHIHRMLFEEVLLCWSCFRLSSEDEALLRACCDCDALVYSGRKIAEGFTAHCGDVDAASELFHTARQKAMAAVRLFLASGKKVEP